MLTITGDLHIVTKLTCLAIDLDTVMEVFFEGRAVKDTVACGARVVNDELVLSSSFSGGDLGLKHRENREKRKPSVSLLRR